MPDDADPAAPTRLSLAEPNDARLLGRYADARDQRAFAELVQRHLDGVYSAALRRVGGDVHLAQDVAQRVFVALARKAATLAEHPFLGAWLYTSTRHEAANVVRAERRRKQHEQEAQTMNPLVDDSGPTATVDWNRIAPLLDAAIDQLTERDRTAIVLRFVERRRFADIAAALQVSEDAARMRVDRALEKLHGLLAKRGIKSTGAALSVALSTEAVSAAPVGLAANIVASTLSGSAVAASAGALVTAFYFMHATKIAVTAAAAAVLAGGVAVYQISQVRGAADELAQARADRVKHARRLAAMEKSAVAVENELAERRAALERFRLAKANDAAAAARQAAAQEQNAKQAKALQQFLSNDPDYRRLNLAAARGDFINGDVGWCLRSIGFTPAQIEQAADLGARMGGVRAPGYFQQFRAIFGDAAAEGLASFKPSSSVYSPSQGVGLDDNSAPISALKKICRDHFYQEDPFTLQQVQRLQGILTRAQTPAGANGITAARYDWDRVVGEAEPILSPTQMNTLRAYAANAKAELLWTEAEEQAAKTAKK